ncbi:MAG: 2-oxoacid:acceptor oxidoreductase family protein [Fibrobacteria bacterium]|nr:2-oxoacid:acceptor oxidoreductase family protein [Fibrobacteria bacterium]
MIKHQKPRAFFDTFERKGPGQKNTHYCPGCGHGTAHKLIAELIDELHIQDRTIFCSPVGCSVFAYYYFDTGNIQCSHGRAPAVATGIRRTHKDSILISYQGDGDLAGIGTAEIIHAANRGENLTVFFINNAIYGMTGGQLAPTTLIGQSTLTSPGGRVQSRDGSPIGMAEIMDAIKTPVFIERVSLATPGKVMRARKVFKKALLNQVQKRGFSFVEVLSPCPVNWKLTPSRARRWMEEKLEPVFPVMNFRETEDLKINKETIPPVLKGEDLLNVFRVNKDQLHPPKAKEISDQFVKISGFGGQGVMSAGVLLANCVIAEGRNATWIPSYGPAMRGGTANASVIVSGKNIGSPLVDYPNVLIAMNLPSLNIFEEKVLPGGFIFINSSIITRKVKREDVKSIYVPASDMAKQGGMLAAANVIMLSLYMLASKVSDIQTLKKVIPLSIKKKEYIDVNLKIVDIAIEFYEKNKDAF